MSGIESRALRVRPPTSVNTVSVTSSASAAQALSVTGRYVTFYSTTLCHVLFGTSAVANPTTSSWPVPAGQYVTWRVPANSDITHFKVIRNAADGTLYWSTSD